MALNWAKVPLSALFYNCFSICCMLCAYVIARNAAETAAGDNKAVSLCNFICIVMQCGTSKWSWQLSLCWHNFANCRSLRSLAELSHLSSVSVGMPCCCWSCLIYCRSVCVATVFVRLVWRSISACLCVCVCGATGGNSWCSVTSHSNCSTSCGGIVGCTVCYSWNSWTFWFCPTYSTWLVLCVCRVCSCELDCILRGNSHVYVCTVSDAKWEPANSSWRLLYMHAVAAVIVRWLAICCVSLYCHVFFCCSTKYLTLCRRSTV